MVRPGRPARPEARAKPPSRHWEIAGIYSQRATAPLLPKSPPEHGHISGGIIRIRSGNHAGKGMPLHVAVEHGEVAAGREITRQMRRSMPGPSGSGVRTRLKLAVFVSRRQVGAPLANL